MIGIDPGAQGGIAIYRVGDPVKAVKMPKDISELGEFLKYYAENTKPIVFLEKLSVRPDDVTDGNMGKLYRIQKLMANFEHLKAIIELSGIPYVLTHPMVWQTKLNLRIKGVKEEKSERKHRYQVKAQQLYPEIKTTLWNADALLLMHFGRWALINYVSWIKEQLPKREQGRIFD